jgi:2-haloacid dehalogenase
VETDLSNIKALTFDIGGTVFDWHSTIRDEVGRLAAERGAPVDAAQFANDWRRGMFELLGQVRGGDLPWASADELHRQALDPLAEKYAALELSAEDRDELNLVWHRLRAWPDAPDAIEALRGRYTIVVLTVLSCAIAVDSSKAAGVGWDGVLSCEFLGHYKPDAEAYQAGVRLLGIEPAEAMMVAAHPGDLRAAMAAGLSSAYVPRPDERGEGNDGDLSPQPDFAVNATDFPDLAKRLLA